MLLHRNRCGGIPRFAQVQTVAGAQEAVKKGALSAAGDDTVRSSVFDAARGIDWPRPWTLRARRNAFHDRWLDNPAGMGLAERNRYAEASAAGDAETMAVIVGEAVDMVRAIEPAAEILDRIAAEAERLLATAPGRLGPTRELAGEGKRA